MSAEKGSACAACGMWVKDPAGYHPYLACAAFKALRDGNSVEANLRAVVKYGMEAQNKGRTLDQAMRSIHR